MAATSAEETRKLIVETAKALLRRYGSDKLTVVDIARALKMSHANVYRFFRNKTDILDAITDEWMTKLENFVDEISSRPAPASARIEAVVLELHRKRKQKLMKDAAVFETYRRVVELRPEVASKRRQKMLEVFKRLIEEGIRSGEFANVNSHEAATVLKDSTSLFLHPLMIPTILNEETEKRARAVVRYVLSGFTAPRPKAATTTRHIRVVSQTPPVRKPSRNKK